MLAHLDAIRKVWVFFTVHISIEAALDTCYFSSAWDVLGACVYRNRKHHFFN